MLLLSASYTPTPLTDTPESTWMAGLAVKGCRLPCNPKSNGVLSYISFIEEEKGHESDEIDQGSMSSKKKKEIWIGDSFLRPKRPLLAGSLFPVWD